MRNRVGVLLGTQILMAGWAPASVGIIREDFIYEAAVLMRDRSLHQQVWENVGLPHSASSGSADGNTTP